MADKDSEDGRLALAVARHLLEQEGAGAAWGIEILEIGPGYARIAMTVTAAMLNGYKVVHGGMTFALADTAFAYACNARNIATVGQAASIVFLAPARLGDRLVAEACEHGSAGRTGVYQVTVRLAQSDEVIATFQGQSRKIGDQIIDNPEK